MKTAVCVLIPADDGQFLAVSRRSSSVRWGLPGGKVDPGESDVEAIVRELQEECGIEGEARDFQPIYAAHCPGDVDYWVTTYLWVGGSAAVGPNEWQPEEGLFMDTLPESWLTNPDGSPFAGYNVGVFDAYRRWLQHA